MHMNGEQHIAAPRLKVWEALNDPEVLRRCIPGCEELNQDGDNRFQAVAEVKIGPIGTRFKGNVELSDLDPPNGYTRAGSGSGGIAGSAKGGAKVRLSEAEGGTLVTYSVEADVGGRMAQLGGPIIDATARNLAGKFFSNFAQVVTGDGSATAREQSTTDNATSPVARAETPVATHAPAAQERAVRAKPAPLWGWVAAVLLALAAGFILGINGRQVEFVAALALLVVTASAAYQAGRHGAAR
jgi:uncharacterized protein